MVSVMKSPNIMSTTGRMPVIAAPTANPVNPASEIGVSTTRSLPNSSTSPDNTLKGVPASATSSPRMQTRVSRRISSASASRIASANVISRTAASGIHVLPHFIQFGIRSCNRKLHRLLHFSFDLRMKSGKEIRVSMILFHQPIPQVFDGVAFRDPLLLFFFRTVVFAVDVANVMAAIPIGVAKNKSGASARARPFHEFSGNEMHRAHILPVHALRLQAERGCTRHNIACCRLGEMRVFRVQIILADVNHRQFPELRQVHHYVQNSLPQCSFTEEAHRNLPSPQLLC